MPKPGEIGGSVACAPALSVIIPIFNEEAILLELAERLTRCLWEMGVSYEIIFVDDGSTDRSGDILERLAADSHIRAVQLSRNFGLTIAVTAGLDHASGELIALMDGDLQDAPEDLPTLVAKVREGYDVVYAIRTKRKESIIKRAVVFAFYRMLSRMTSTPLPVDSGLFSVMTRPVVNALKRLPERSRYLSGLRAWVGFTQCGVPIERATRRVGAPRQTWRKLSRLAIDGMVSFSYVPLRLATVAGIVTAILSAAGGVWAVYMRLSSVNPPPGWASIVLIVLFIGSVQLLALGVIGEYIGRVYDEVKGRPLYVVRARKGFAQQAEAAGWQVGTGCESR
ncbi:MAG: glycosyltransferase family 2 protein [Candidatus Omnitrophica bacterium]|nr:glycosyltransferase family 2 protein [Candidatus Omnitrophota bacterium]